MLPNIKHAKIDGRKCENRGITIARVNSFITKSINLQLFTVIVYVVGVRCNQRRFSVLSPFIEKSMINAVSMHSPPFPSKLLKNNIIYISQWVRS